MAEEVKPPKPFEKWLVITQISVVAFTLLCVLGLLVVDKPVWPLVGTGLGVLVLLRFDEIASFTFKGFGLETAITRAKQAEKDALEAAEEAKSTAAEAKKTIESLKQLGMNLTSSVMPLLVASGTPELKTSVEVAIGKRQSIKHHFEAMGLTQQQIADVFSGFDNLAVIQLVYETANRLEFTFQPSELSKKTFPTGKNLILKKLVLKTEHLKDFFGDYTNMTLELENWSDEIATFTQTGEIDFDKFRQLKQPEVTK